MLKYDLQLFAKEGPGGEKTEEPTTKKLTDARKKGQAAKSEDLTTAVILLAFFVIIRVYIGTLGEGLISAFQGFYSHIAEISGDAFTLQLACSYVGNFFYQVILWTAPFLAIFFVIAFVTQVAQVKWKISTEPMKPKLSKINPVSGVKRMFSKDKLVKFAMSVLKIAIICVVIYSYIRNKWSLILNLYDYSLLQVISLEGDIIFDIGLRIAICFILLSFADYAYQKWKFHDDMKMTKQEVKDEYKQTEGDPKVKSQQRRRMQQASQRRMMQAVPEADVVITNPTHLAAALKYQREQYDAPIVVAKGADYIAERIKEIARENDVAIVENKPLARMLYYNVEIGDQIPPELYQMVAEVLAYVYGLKGKV